MATVGRLSRALLRSALTQSRRPFSAAAAAEHGEHTGACVALTRGSFSAGCLQSSYGDLAG